MNYDDFMKDKNIINSLNLFSLQIIPQYNHIQNF